jgi:K+-transporting ATPase KdpF subunit
MSISLWIAGALTLALCAYLLYALLRPEKF